MHILLILITLIFSACNSVKKTMGVLQETPDEYAVMPQQKLQVPMHLNIPTPSHELGALEIVPSTEDTKGILLQKPTTKPTSYDAKLDQALLQHLPIKPEPNIRTKVNMDLQKPKEQSLLFWQKQIKGKALDATAEAERLKESNEIISSGS